MNEPEGARTGGRAVPGASATGYVSASTRVLALLGDPVVHSLSPRIQNAAFRAAAVDGVYVALHTAAEGLPALIQALSHAGGGGNVTLPHKQQAASLVERPSDSVRRTGALNTFWREDGVLAGDNTDVNGFQRALESVDPTLPEGAHVLLMGAGGAARAVLVGLLDGGAERVDMLNRSVEKARAVARRIGGDRVRVLESKTELEGSGFDLVVNSTSLGLSADDPLPLDLGLLDHVGAAMDLVYGPAETPFVRHARRRTAVVADGSEMLVQQGAVSFERWWGRPAPVDVMRAELVALRGGERS